MFNIFAHNVKMLSGAMKTGWLKSGGKWYYLSSSGSMQTGWQKIWWQVVLFL